MMKKGLKHTIYGSWFMLKQFNPFLSLKNGFYSLLGGTQSTHGFPLKNSNPIPQKGKGLGANER